jgi:4Fe-4S ferredoxin
MVFVQRDGVESRKLTHSNDMCVACGICTDCCPTDSLRLNDVLAIRRGQADGDYLRIDDETCVLCGLCASSCAFGALTFEIDGKDTKELANYPTWTHDSNIDEDLCELCGRCHEVCPQDTIFYKRVLPERSALLKGEISIDELPVPILESEEERQKRLEEAEQSRDLTLKAKGGADNG